MHDPTLLGVRVASTLLQVIGLVCAVWRIYYRFRIDRFWWDDAWAIAVLLSCLTSLVGEWIFAFTFSRVGSWLFTLSFVCVVRATHLSILFSIIRIIRGSRLVIFTYFCVGCCGIFWVIIFSEKIWNCASHSRWHHRHALVCITKRRVLIFELTSNCVTVAVLVLLPLRVFWKVNLPRQERSMILGIFASNVVLALAAIFHVVGHVLDILDLMLSGIYFEVVTSIIMCNLLVVVTYMYHSLWRDDGHSRSATASESDADDFTQPPVRAEQPPLSLTTVEIDPSIAITGYSTHISSTQA